MEKQRQCQCFLNRPVEDVRHLRSWVIPLAASGWLSLSSFSPECCHASAHAYLCPQVEQQSTGVIQPHFSSERPCVVITRYAIAYFGLVNTCLFFCFPSYFPPKIDRFWVFGVRARECLCASVLVISAVCARDWLRSYRDYENWVGAKTCVKWRLITPSFGHLGVTTQVNYKRNVWTYWGTRCSRLPKIETRLFFRFNISLAINLWKLWRVQNLKQIWTGTFSQLDWKLSSI